MKLAALLLAVPLVACQTSPMAPASSRDQANHGNAGHRDWKLSVAPGPDGNYVIQVADDRGNPVQQLAGPPGEAPFDASELLRLEDFNGDAHPDILARGLSVGVSALTSETIYVFDPAARRFLEAQAFEHEGEVTKAGAGCITVEYRNTDNMTYTRDGYCWEAGHWIRVDGKD